MVGGFFFEFKPTYIGLLCGEPTEKMNQQIIDRKINTSENWDIDDVNIIKSYSGYFGGFNDYDKNEEALKLIMCSFCIEKDNHLLYVITFVDENQSPEEVITNITDSHALKTVEYDF